MDSGMREYKKDLREAFRRGPAEDVQIMEHCMALMRRTHPLLYLRLTSRLGGAAAMRRSNYQSER